MGDVYIDSVDLTRITVLHRFQAGYYRFDRSIPIGAVPPTAPVDFRAGPAPAEVPFRWCCGYCSGSNNPNVDRCPNCGAPRAAALGPLRDRRPGDLQDDIRRLRERAQVYAMPPAPENRSVRR